MYRDNYKEGIYMDIIEKMDKNIDPRIYKIMNESYEEFVKKYGDKHSKHIEETLKIMSNRIKANETYMGSMSASAMFDAGIVYTKGVDNLEAVLKHELWHTFNRATMDYRGKESISYLSDRYNSFI